MKNRFFVINKEKVYAYIVSIMTIVIIFTMSSIMNDSDLKETEEVYSNDVEANIEINNSSEELTSEE